jgi:hypothetical protein
MYSEKIEPHYIVGTSVPAAVQNDYIGPFGAIEHPCHWNKIRVGDTVAIPLYTTDVSTGGATAPDTETIKNPVDIDLTKLKIKIRTACRTGNEMCLDLERYTLDGTIGDPYSLCQPGGSLCGDVIVSWQINGTNVAGDKIYTMVAAVPKADTAKTGLVRTINNTEIYESLINDAAQSRLTSVIPGWACNGTSDLYCVLYADTTSVAGIKYRQGKDLLTGYVESIMDFLRNEGTYANRSTLDKINKPVLKLTVVHSLSESPTTSIPYLEYQVTSNVGTNTGFDPADSAQTIRAEGQSGPFKQVLEVKMPQETGLLEYVIQQ